LDRVQGLESGCHPTVIPAGSNWLGS